MTFGIYRHRKGGLYLAFGRVRSATNAREGMRDVLYVGLSGFWTRDEREFFDGRFRRLL